MKLDALLGCFVVLLSAAIALPILAWAIGTFFALVWAAFEFWR